MSTLALAIEAILFSSNRPLRVRELQQVTESNRATIEEALDELRDSLTHRGVMLQRHHDQVQLVTRPELAAYVRRALRPEVTGRLSSAARNCSRASLPITACSSRTISGYGAGPTQEPIR